MELPPEIQKLVVEESVKHIVGIMGKALEWGGEKVDSIVGKGTKLKDEFVAARNYLETFTQRHGQVKVLGMTNPVPLSSIYTAVQILSPDHLRAFGDHNALKSAFRTSVRFALGEKKDGLKVANESQFLTVLGQPGAGKSTFLKRIGWEALQPEKSVFRKDLGRVYEHHCLPVLIELKTFRWEKEVNLEGIIERELSTCGFPKKFVPAALKKGKLLVLMDGLDEVPGDKVDQVVDHIKEFADKYRENRFITSCRTAFYKNAFPRFTDVLLADFDNLQIEAFIKNWFSSREDRQNQVAADFWKMIKEPKHSAILELGRTPLLLTFLCLKYNDSRSLPVNRSNLYEEALRILLEKWSAEKRVNRETIYEGFHTDLEVLLLEEIAGAAFEMDKVTFNRKELTDSIAAFFKNELKAPQTLNGTKVLEAIEIQQGILVQRALGLFTFSHLTLQEYLAASYFVRGRMKEIVSKHLFDTRWREVFLLMAGMGRADEMLKQMARTIQERAAAQPGVCALLRWANDVIELGDGGDRLVRSSVAVQLGLIAAASPDRALGGNNSDRDFNNTFDLAYGLGLDLDRDDLNAVVDRSLVRDRVLAFARVLDRVVHRAIDRVLDQATVPELDRALDRALARDLDQDIDNTVQLVEKLEKTNILRRKFADQCRKQLACVKKLHRTIVPRSDEPLKLPKETYDGIMSALGIAPEVKQISLNNWNFIEKYLEATRLIVECKNAAMSVTKDGWDAAAEMMLRARGK